MDNGGTQTNGPKNKKIDDDAQEKGNQLEIIKEYFSHADKWYIHILESVLENDIQKVLRHFQIQTNHPSQTEDHT